MERGNLWTRKFNRVIGPRNAYTVLGRVVGEVAAVFERTATPVRTLTIFGRKDRWIEKRREWRMEGWKKWKEKKKMMHYRHTTECYIHVKSRGTVRIALLVGRASILFQKHTGALYFSRGPRPAYLPPHHWTCTQSESESAILVFNLAEKTRSRTHHLHS